MACSLVDTHGRRPLDQSSENVPNSIKREKLKNRDKGDDESSASLSSDDMEYIVYEGGNTINSLMSDCYKKSPIVKHTDNDKSGTSSSLSKQTGADQVRNTPVAASSTASSLSHTKAAVLDETVNSNVQNSTPEEKPKRPHVTTENLVCNNHLGIKHSVETQQKGTGTVVHTPLQSATNTPNSEKVVAVNSKLKSMDQNELSSKTLSKSRPKKRKSTNYDASADLVQKKSKTDAFLCKPTLTFADIGGSDKRLLEICQLLLHLKHPEIYNQLGVTPPHGLLLHGPPGCGKTLMANVIAGELQLPYLKVSAPEVVKGVSGESESVLRELFELAKELAPSILFIDEVDCITPKRENTSKEMERRIVAQLLTCLDDLTTSNSNHVLVIGATNRVDALDPALRRAGRFDREICLGIPDEDARQKILEVLCRKLTMSPDLDLSHLAHLTPGYVGADLAALICEASISAVNRVFESLSSAGINDVSLAPHPPPVQSLSSDLNQSLSWLKDIPALSPEQLADLAVTFSDFQAALKKVQPSAKREGFATVPDTTWEDVGALKDIRDELQMAILAPVNHQQAFERLGLRKPPGILLAGPPGCGKTLLAKAIANESGINFISVKGPELLNMYVGESERAVRQVFTRARNSAPCVIFFDELDSLCPVRGGVNEGGSSTRVVNQMLTEMDGLEERRQVYVMAATNRPDIIDPAILRPGRLDKVLYVGLPSLGDRIEILRTITKKGTKPRLHEDVSLETVARNCDNFSGADLASLIREASIVALKQHITSPVLSNSVIEISKHHFIAAFDKVKPSVSENDRRRYDDLQKRLKT